MTFSWNGKRKEKLIHNGYSSCDRLQTRHGVSSIRSFPWNTKGSEKKDFERRFIMATQAVLDYEIKNEVLYKGV